MGWCQTAWASGELHAVTVLSSTHVFSISLGPGAVLRTAHWRGWYLWPLVISGPGKSASKNAPVLSMAHTLPLNVSKGISYIHKHSHRERLVLLPRFVSGGWGWGGIFPHWIKRSQVKCIAPITIWIFYICINWISKWAELHFQLVYSFYFCPSSRPWFCCLVLLPFWSICPFTGSLGTRLLLRILSAHSLKYLLFSGSYLFVLF